MIRLRVIKIIVFLSSSFLSVLLSLLLILRININVQMKSLFAVSSYRVWSTSIWLFGLIFWEIEDSTFSFSRKKKHKMIIPMCCIKQTLTALNREIVQNSCFGKRSRSMVSSQRGGVILHNIPHKQLIFVYYYYAAFRFSTLFWNIYLCHDLFDTILFSLRYFHISGPYLDPKIF